MLALPGVIFSAFLTVVAINYALGYSEIFTFAEGLLFGSIMAATDPVAVVSLLKDLGAP